MEDAQQTSRRRGLDRLDLWIAVILAVGFFFVLGMLFWIF